MLSSFSRSFPFHSHSTELFLSTIIGHLLFSHSASNKLYFLSDHLCFPASGALDSNCNFELMADEALVISGEAKEKNAGELFVLESKGTWLHAAYHLTTAIVGPAILSLPYAYAQLGWFFGISAMLLGSAVTFYGYSIISRLLVEFEERGSRHLRFRDLATEVVGPFGSLVVVTIQFLVCLGIVIGSALLSGQGMQIIYSNVSPKGTMKLYQFILIAGGLLALLSQLPSFHSLRHINLISSLLSLGYSLAIVAGSIYAGHSKHAPSKDYSLKGSDIHKVFGVFNALGIIATSFGTSLIPEIQATISPPVAGKMQRGLLFCYAIVACTFFSVAISGYWAFGNLSDGNLLNNLSPDEGPSLAPDWLLFIAILCVILQLFAIGVVYAQPMFEVLESYLSNPKHGILSVRNFFPRILSRSIYIMVSSLVAAMLPFFGDLNAFIGAVGFIPLGFVVPMVFYLAAYRPSVWTLAFWIHGSLLVIFSVVGILGVVSSVRQIALDAHKYKLFGNSTTT